MKPLVPLAQADAEWHHDILGHGGPDDTLGLYGCADSSWAMLANAMGVTGHATPRTVNNFLKGIPGAFVDLHGKPGVLFNFVVAAHSMGLVAHDNGAGQPWGGEGFRLRADIGDPRLADLAGATLAKGGGLIFHVDHNKDVPGGDPRGDHFIACAEYVGAHIDDAGIAHAACFKCGDPAPGDFCFLDARSLSGTSKWGSKDKHYNVVSVIPVFRAA